MAPGHSGWGAHGWTLVLKPYPLWFCCVSNSYTHEGFCSRSMLQGTLGGRVFSCAVSSFGQASSTQEKTSGTQGSSRGTLREQSFSVCTNDFMGTLHPREQNFHPAKCSTIFNRLNIWEQAPGANWANLKTLPRVYWHMQNEPGACVGSKTPCALKVGQWNERVRAKTCDAVDWDSA